MKQRSWEAYRLSVHKFPVLYGTRKLLHFSRAHNWSLSWVIWIQSTASHHTFRKSHSNIIFISAPRSSELTLPFWLYDKKKYVFLCFLLQTGLIDGHGLHEVRRDEYSHRNNYRVRCLILLMKFCHFLISRLWVRSVIADF